MTTVKCIINNFIGRLDYSYEDYELDVEFAILDLLGLSRNEFIQDWVTEQQYMQLQIFQELAE